MSGTSLDGVDVATVLLGGEEERPEPARLLHFLSQPYEPSFRRHLEDVLDSGGAEELCDLNFELGRRFAGAVWKAMEAQGLDRGAVAAVGSHGQTVWHRPPPARGDEGAEAAVGPATGATLQLGEPAAIAERVGVPVVADFRVRDVAAGGHGAPLSPYFDFLFLRGGVPRAIQNLGGMGNVTALPPTGSGERPTAFDTGPGVALLDAAARILTEGRMACDRDGEMAAAGTVLEGPLDEWLDDPFFQRAPPRSTGRERFGSRRVEGWIRHREDARPADLMATLTELTARSVAEAYDFLPFDVEEVYLCGGGARNPTLRRRLEEHLEPRTVRTLESLGWEGDAREAAAFALLARQHVRGISVDVTWATGAAGPRVLGKRVPA